MRYGDNDVLTGVDFDIHAGEVVCLLGPNGAGKTTTIEILEGFRIRSAGDITVLGEDPRHGGRGLAGPHRGGAPVLARPPAVDAPPAAHQLGGYYAPYSTPERSAALERSRSCSTSSA